MRNLSLQDPWTLHASVDVIVSDGQGHVIEFNDLSGSGVSGFHSAYGEVLNIEPDKLALKDAAYQQNPIATAILGSKTQSHLFLGETLQAPRTRIYTHLARKSYKDQILHDFGTESHIVVKAPEGAIGQKIWPVHLEDLQDGHDQYYDEFLARPWNNLPSENKYGNVLVQEGLISDPITVNNQEYLAVVRMCARIQAKPDGTCAVDFHRNDWRSAYYKVANQPLEPNTKRINLYPQHFMSDVSLYPFGQPVTRELTESLEHQVGSNLQIAFGNLRAKSLEDHLKDALDSDDLGLQVTALAFLYRYADKKTEFSKDFMHYLEDKLEAMFDDDPALFATFASDRHSNPQIERLYECIARGRGDPLDIPDLRERLSEEWRKIYETSETLETERKKGFFAIQEAMRGVPEDSKKFEDLQISMALSQRGEDYPVMRTYARRALIGFQPEGSQPLLCPFSFA